MAITAAQVGAGVGGASIGVLGAEGIQHAERRGIVSDRTGTLVATGIGVGTIGLGAASLAGIAPIPPEVAATVGGYGLGSSAWYTAREGGIAPRLTIDVPAEVNLADPLVTAAVFGIVGVAATTAARAVF